MQTSTFQEESHVKTLIVKAIQTS